MQRFKNDNFLLNYDEKKRRISISDPRLKFIRDTLRYVLVSKAKELRSSIIAESLKEKDKEILKDLRKKEMEMSDIIYASICSYASCHAIDKDMIFNPSVKQWFCPDCYEMMANEYRIRKGARILGEDYDDFHEEYYKSFTY
ncbi:MAG: hypothetical protein ACTSV5_02395 [Promethearchaeota archaeon]